MAVIGASPDLHPKRPAVDKSQVSPAVSVYDELPDGLLLADAAGCVQLLNSPGAHLLGLDADGATAAVGRPLAEVMPLHTDAGDDWWRCLAPVAALPTSRRSPERLLTLAATSASPPRGLSVTVRWTREQGRVVRTAVAFRDTAGRDRLERGKADLVSTVAHELRSPLTSVKGFTATLLAKWDRFTDEQKKLMLETVNADADRVTRLLSELLDVSRIDAGRLEVRRQVVDVGAAVRKAVSGRVASGEPGDRFAVELVDGLPEMWLDPDKVDQVVGNLVENAVRHGDGTVHVLVRPRGDGTPGAEVTVADEGDGIPEESLARVFAKFWRGGDRRGGTGLGLYIVKGLTEVQGGSVRAGRSATYGGAELTVLLPAGAAPYEL